MYEADLRSDHVEDMHHNQRLVLEDEPWVLNNILDENYHPNSARELPYDWKEHERILADVNHIQQVNRYRRNYLLLRDWNGKRPFKRIYYIFDTSIDQQDYFRGPIQSFYDYIQRANLPQFNVGIDEDSPSRKGNIYAGMYPIHPISKFDGFNEGHYNLHSATCQICLNPFMQTELIMRLHCDHFFHNHCMRHHWDAIGRSTYDCPLCPNASNWTLHSVGAIHPEAIDVWDNVQVTGLKHASMHPNLSTFAESMLPGKTAEATIILNDYWYNETNNTLLSNTWGDEVRSLSVEMSKMRTRRRIMHRQRAAAAAAAAAAAGGAGGGGGGAGRGGGGAGVGP